MANETINAQAALSAMATDDVIAIWDTSAAAMKKITYADFWGGGAPAVAITGASFAAHGGSKAANIQGGGFDGTRFWAGYTGFGAYWNGSNWRTGTDGGSNGATMILSEGDGSNLQLYTFPSTGTAQQTIAPGSLSNYLRLSLADTGLTLATHIRAAYDTNTASFFGRARVGYDGATNDMARFSHLDQSGSSNYALSQSAAGATWINCVSGQLLVFARAGSEIAYFDTLGNFVPGLDNAFDNGKSSQRWNDIWATNATIQTSDERDKVMVKPSDLGLDFIRALDPISWRWADREIPARTRVDVDDEGNEIVTTQPAQAVKYKRPHYGLSAQQVKATLDTLGVADFAGYIYDEPTDSYALRYNEFIAPMIKAIQELAAEVASLKSSKTRKAAPAAE